MILYAGAEYLRRTARLGMWRCKRRNSATRLSKPSSSNGDYKDYWDSPKRR